MVINISLIVIILLLLLLIIFILYFIEKKNRHELSTLDNKRKIVEYYLHKVDEIKQAQVSDEEKIEKIRLLSKKLFNEYYEVDLDIPYTELIEFFKKSKKKQLLKFSELMVAHYYKEERISKKTVDELIEILKREIKNIPLGDLNIRNVNFFRGNKKEIDLKIKELLHKTKSHLKQKNKSKAEESYKKLEEAIKSAPPVEIKVKKKTEKIYDRIIKLHSKSKDVKSQTRLRKKIKKILKKASRDITHKKMSNASKDYKQLKKVYSKLENHDKGLQKKISLIHSKMTRKTSKGNS